MVLACAVLLLLALVTYTPTDPSADTVADWRRPAAHNWIGLRRDMAGRSAVADVGIAAFFLPVVMGRVGACWMRQRPQARRRRGFLGWGFGSSSRRRRWDCFREHLWRHALPIEGVRAGCWPIRCCTI